MKINKKALELIEKGLSSGTVYKLTESQINDLHSKLVSEVTMVSKNDSETINRLKTEKKPFEVYEKEMKEDQEDSMDFEKGERTQDLKQVGPSSNDGFDNYGDGTGEFNESKTKSNAYSICHSQVGPKKSRKWERCVQSVKKQLEEGKNPVSLFIENQIMKIVEKNLPPRITKGDLIRHLSEGENFATKHLQSFGKSSGTETAPAKPKTSPTTKPGTKPQRPAHPGKNPNPGEKEAPKAKKEVEEQGPGVAPSKPKVKPKTKPQRPAHPGKNPNPGEKEAPKAKKPSPEETKDKVIDVILNLLQK